MITYRVRLDVPGELVLFVSRLLARHRKELGTRKGTRSLGCYRQARFVLAWYGDNTDIARLGTGFGLSRATSYRYVNGGHGGRGRNAGLSPCGKARMNPGSMPIGLHWSFSTAHRITVRTASSVHLQVTSVTTCDLPVYAALRAGSLPRARRRWSAANWSACSGESSDGSCPPTGAESLIAVNDAALRPVRRADRQQHAIVLDYADVVFRHPPRHPREDLVPVGECHGVEAVPAHPGDSSLGLDEVSPRHGAPRPGKWR